MLEGDKGRRPRGENSSRLRLRSPLGPVPPGAAVSPAGARVPLRPQNPLPLMLMDWRSATCITLMPLLARRAMPSGQMASMATMLVAMRAEGVAPPLPSAEAPVSMGTAETFMATLLAAPPFLFWWVLMCLERWSLRMKRLGHSGQANFFSPGRREGERGGQAEAGPVPPPAQAGKKVTDPGGSSIPSPTCVRALVSLQLVAPGETLPAEDPGTDEGSLPGVPPQVSPEVRGFAVHLPAARDVADVLLFFTWIPRAPERVRRKELKQPRKLQLTGGRENGVKQGTLGVSACSRGFGGCPGGPALPDPRRSSLTFPRCLCSRDRYMLPSALSVLAGAADPGWSLLPPQPRSRLPARLRSCREDPAEHRGRLEENTGGYCGFFISKAPSGTGEVRGAFPGLSPRQLQSREGLSLIEP